MTDALFGQGAVFTPFAGFERFGGRDEAVPKGLGIYGLRFRV